MSGCRSRSQALRFSIRCLIEFTFQVAMRMRVSRLLADHAESRGRPIAVFVQVSGNWAIRRLFGSNGCHDKCDNLPYDDGASEAWNRGCAPRGRVEPEGSSGLSNPGRGIVKKRALLLGVIIV